ncbi:MAG: hypothetical protein KF817_08045 [Phycisphaeraceae bacterium]|nr:hypothetical protein [Phycisphaeraceae bacterium]
MTELKHADAQPTTRSRTDRRTPTAILWGSAVILGGMVLLQAGRMPVNPAYGGSALSGGDLTALTASMGRGRDTERYELLYVVDNRTETLLVYEIEDARNKEIILRSGGRLADLFARAIR